MSRGPSHRWTAALTAPLIGSLVACQGPPDPDGGPPVLRNAVVFLSNRDGNQQVYVLDLGSRAVARLPLPEPGVPSGPEVSPDGTKIALALKGIWVMNVDGSGAVKISPSTPWTKRRVGLLTAVTSRSPPRGTGIARSTSWTRTGSTTAV